MGYAGEGLLEQNAQRILGHRVPVQEASEGKKRFLRGTRLQAFHVIFRQEVCYFLLVS